MEIELNWQKNIHFVASNADGHQVSLDGSPEFGGQGAGARPMEMVLFALASCMAIDVVLMLKKSRIELSACQIRVRAQRGETIPKVFKSIHLDYHLEGEGLTEVIATRSLALSAEKYCSVAAMLRPMVKISYAHNVQD